MASNTLGEELSHLSGDASQSDSGMSVDPSSNIRGAYRTLYFKCPKCDYSRVFLNSKECPQCSIKLNWK